MMPKREDLFEEGEYADVEKQLHRHVLYQVEEGDIVVVDARGDMTSGIFGDMMMTYFKGLKGAGVVIDGCVRDWAKVQKLGIPMWLRGVTPNYHAQTALMPMAVNVPVACGGVTVIPGDIIVADDDGAVCVPVALAEAMVKKAHKDHGWEEFSREKLLAGESLQALLPAAQGRLAGIRGLAGRSAAGRRSGTVRGSYQLVTEPSLRTRCGASHGRKLCLRDQRLVDLDAEARRVADAVAGAFERQHARGRARDCRSRDRARPASARLEPGEVRRRRPRSGPWRRCRSGRAGCAASGRRSGPRSSRRPSSPRSGRRHCRRRCG